MPQARQTPQGAAGGAPAGPAVQTSALAKSRAGLQNYNVAVREWNDQVIFLRKIVAGPADKSYGIHVARLAGLPDEIIGRARQILAHLESNAATPDARSASPRRRGRAARTAAADGSLPDHAAAPLTLF